MRGNASYLLSIVLVLDQRVSQPVADRDASEVDPNVAGRECLVTLKDGVCDRRHVVATVRLRGITGTEVERSYDT